MLFYIDYLDHVTSGFRSFNSLKMRLRFDLLVFGHDILCMSVPSCIKLQDTTNLLMQLDEFWMNGKIQLQLDERHKGNPIYYFNNRKKVLAKGMPEGQLVNHFEFIAYQSNRPKDFFDTYLREQLSVSNKKLYIEKQKDTDALFRKSSIELFHYHYDNICKILGADRSIIFTGITNRIEAVALDNSSLYQRSVIEDSITDEFKPRIKEQQIVSSLLDRAFALANAGTSAAVPLSLVLNQLTGIWLQKILYMSYSHLYDLICGLTWSEIYALSQNDNWTSFIQCINAFIALVQDANAKKYSIDMDRLYPKLSFSIALLNLLRFVKKEAINAMKNKLFDCGLISEAQNLEGNIDLIIDCYSGKNKHLIDVVCAIDFFAERVIEDLTKIKKYEYIVNLGSQQAQYEIFK